MMKDEENFYEVCLNWEKLPEISQAVGFPTGTCGKLKSEGFFICTGREPYPKFCPKKKKKGLRTRRQIRKMQKREKKFHGSNVVFT